MKELLLTTLLLASHMHAMESGAEKGIQKASTNTQESGQLSQTKNQAQPKLYKAMEGGNVVLKNAQGEKVAYYTTSGVWMPLTISADALFRWIIAESKQ